MIGYKGFDADWQCLNFQYQLGQTYDMPENELKMCYKGFHFCKYPLDVLGYYNAPGAIYAQVRADGKVIEEYNKCVTNQITIVKQITRQQVIDSMPPMIERVTGTREYYANGQFHRIDGPAIEYANGDKYWYLNGQPHRDDGPAIEYANEEKHWYQNGRLHRIDGPAIDCVSGYKAWYLNGQRHRDDGPAIETPNGDKHWYQNGQFIGLMVL